MCVFFVSTCVLKCFIHKHTTVSKHGHNPEEEKPLLLYSILCVSSYSRDSHSLYPYQYGVVSHVLYKYTHVECLKVTEMYIPKNNCHTIKYNIIDMFRISKPR